MDPQIVEFSHRLSRARRILLCTHRTPDGDGFSSMIGFSHTLEGLNKDVRILCPEGSPAQLRFLPGADSSIPQLDDSETFDLTIVFDTSADERIPQGFPQLDRCGEIVFIDHHPDQRSTIPALLIRREAPATGEMVFDLIRALSLPLDSRTAQCLYTAIMADTSSFRYAVTTAHTHRVAAELIECGANPSQTARQLYERIPISRQRLFGAVLRTLQLNPSLHFAWMTCDDALLAAHDATVLDLDGMVNAARGMNGVEVAAIFYQDGGGTSAELRTRGHADLGTRLGALSPSGPRHGRKIHFQSASVQEAILIICDALSVSAGR